MDGGGSAAARHLGNAGATQTFAGAPPGGDAAVHQRLMRHPQQHGMIQSTTAADDACKGQQ